MNLMTVFFLQAPVAGPAGGGSMMWIMPVSYTHLDVYKRQIQLLGSGSQLSFCRINTFLCVVRQSYHLPVSYTHLATD